VDYSLDQFCADRCRRRRQAVTTLRRLETIYRGAPKFFWAACDDFLRQLEQTPRESVFAYHTTVDKLLEAKDRLRVYQGELTVSNVRLQLNDKLLTASEAATWFIRKYDADYVVYHQPSTRKARIAHAVALLENVIREIDEELTSLKQSRESVIAAAQCVIRRVNEAARMTLLDRSAEAVVNLERLLSYCFPGSIPLGQASKATRQAARLSIRARLLKQGLRRCFNELASQIYANMESVVPQALEHKKCKLFKATAQELSTELDNWCENQRTAAHSRIATAVLAMRFMFVSARQRVGNLSTIDQARYERELAKASPSDVQGAIDSLLRRGLLVADDCELFSYTPSVGRVFREYSVGRT
jgi:hypothetical protein